MVTLVTVKLEKTKDTKLFVNRKTRGGGGQDITTVFTVKIKQNKDILTACVTEKLVGKKDMIVFVFPQFYSYNNCSASRGDRVNLKLAKMLLL